MGAADGPALPLRNRVVFPAITTGFAGPRGEVTDRLLAWYRVRGAGGAAMVITEPAQVSVLGGSYHHRLRAESKAAMPHLERLAAAIGSGGARAVLQLNHYGTRLPRGAARDNAAGALVSASGRTLPDGRLVRALATAEVDALIVAFATAAARARTAGFDAVELQAGHGNLIHQFLSPTTNQRQDRFGGEAEGRLRIVSEVLSAIRTATGPDFPILVRISAAEMTPDGYAVGWGQDIAQAAVAAGAAAVHVSAGTPEASPDLPLCAGVGEATLAPLASAVRDRLGPGVPLILAGRVVTPEGAEEVLQDGTADLVALGRALIAEPAWPQKVAAGRLADIRPCIGCMACQSLPGSSAGPGIGCPVNPDAGREAEFTIEPALPQEGRRVAIWGTGIAGLEAARVAAQRGHQVTIWSDGWPLGGLLGLRSVVPGLAEMGRAILAYGELLRSLRVPVRDGAPADADVILDARPGPEQRPEWAIGDDIWLARRVLSSDLTALIPLRRRVAVCGDTSVVADVALFLAGWGKRPTIVTTSDDPLRDLHPTLAAHVRRRLEGYKIAIETQAHPIIWEPEAGPEVLGRPTGLLVVFQRGEQCDLGPFHSVVAVPGWEESGPTDPAELADTIPDGAPLCVLGDSSRPDRWRDLTQFAARVARRL